MAKIFAGSLAVVLWAAAATAEVAPEAPPPEPLPISFSDIAERAATEVAALRAAETLLDRAPSLDQIEALLTEREAGVARRLVQLQRSLRMAASLDAIGEIEGEWQDTDRQLQAWADRLQGQSAVVEQELQRLDAGLAIWQATLREARAGAAPAEILGLTEATLESIEEARTGLKRLSDRTLGLLGRVGRARDAAAQALARVEDEKGAFVAQLATRDRAPLWSETVRGTSPRELASAARTELAAQAAALAVVWRQERDRVVFQLMVLLVLGLALRGARGESDADAPERREPGLLDQPFSLAALLTLLSTPWLYVSTPAALDDLVEVLLVVPVLRLLFPLVGRPLESALLALAGLYLADQLRDLVEAAPLLSRLLFLLEILAALALGGWLLHALPRQDAGQRRMAKVRLSTAAGVLRFALLLLGVAGLAAVAGFVRLGVLLGGGVLRSAYLAVLLVALARAGEATLKMVLRGRALRRLKVLEGRRRPLEKRARQGLRFVLGVSWAVATLELFALRDPILEIARVILFTELEAGAISLSLSDVLAFVATVLAAVLLARAVTLALEEDVYPRLRLGRGVPYAISTITRYGIILM
ncbi:MAG: hypothetical protein HKP30_04565, partial [Myxococcales bacterium]|nr:hypothetical protein [Myxococcales bacterium]